MLHDDSTQAEMRNRLLTRNDAGTDKATPTSGKNDLISDMPDLTLEVAPSVVGLMYRRQQRVFYQEHGCWSRSITYNFDELAAFGEKYGLPFDVSQGDAVALVDGFLLACRASAENEACQETFHRRWSDTNSGMARFEPPPYHAIAENGPKNLNSPIAQATDIFQNDNDKIGSIAPIQADVNEFLASTQHDNVMDAIHQDRGDPDRSRREAQEDTMSWQPLQHSPSVDFGNIKSAADYDTVRQRIAGKPPIPVEIGVILAELDLSATAMLAWWIMPNTYLDGRIPCDEWGKQPGAVLDAAGNVKGTRVA